MEKYKIVIKRPALKAIKMLPRKDVKKILAKIQDLSFEPRPNDCKKLSTHNIYRVRCGLYRILYSIEDNILVVTVVKIGHRKDTYRF